MERSVNTLGRWGLLAPEAEALATWFHAFTASFADGDALSPLLELKRLHSFRVSTIARELAEALTWDDDEIRAAQTAGLLHDVGRFPQYASFGTFYDGRSLDHGEKGRDVIATEAPLAACSGETREALLQSVALHNKKALPETIPLCALPLARLIRDADKLDVFHIVHRHVQEGRITQLLPGIDETGPLSHALIREVENAHLASYANVRSLADFLLVQLTWVFDLNYPPSLERLRKTGIVEDIAIRVEKGHTAVRRLIADAWERLENPRSLLREEQLGKKTLTAPPEQ